MLSDATKAAVLEALGFFKENNRRDYIMELGETDAQFDMRLAAAITEVKAAGEWRPVADGEVTSFAYVDNGGKLLGVYAGDDYTDWYATEDLPDHIRLCEYIGSQNV